jgi:hypothetical protein
VHALFFAANDGGPPCARTGTSKALHSPADEVQSTKSQHSWGDAGAGAPPARAENAPPPPPFFFFFFSRRSEGAGRPEASERALAVNARRRGAGGVGLASPPTPSHSIASSPAEPAMRVAARARTTAAERMVCGWKNRGACVCACRSDASVSHAPACVRGSCALGTCNAGASKVRRKGGARLASAWEGESQRALTLCFVC